MKNSHLIILLVFVSIHALFASDWKKMHGKHVTLEFNPGYETLADSMVNIADRAIPRLAALQGVPLASFNETKTRIILTDAPDISNGYAIENAIVIFARSSMYLDLWSGPHTWYKQVLEHELGHHLTFRAIKRTANLFGQLPLATTPRWFFEGTAQYFAETWAPFRGDIYLKEAVLNGRFNYNSLNDLSNGRLLYAAGHAYIRFLADQFGDSSLVNLMAYEKDGFYYDFDAAFKNVYGKKPKDLFPYFARHLIIYYGSKAATYPVLDFKKTLPAFGYRDLQIIPIKDADSTYLVSTIEESNHLYKSTYIVQIKEGVESVLKNVTDNFSTKLFISPDNNFIAFGRYNMSAKFNQTGIDYEWFVYDRKSGMLKKVVDNIRAFNAAFTDENDLVLAETRADKTIIKKFPNPFLSKKNIISDKELYSTDRPIGQMIGMEKGSILFEAQAKNAQRDLYILKDGIAAKLTDDVADNRNPIVLNKDYIAFNQMIDNNPAIAILNRKTEKISVKINQQFPLWLHSFNARKNEIITMHKDAGSNTVFAAIKVDSLLKMSILPQRWEDNKKYSSWTKKVATPDSIEGEGAAIAKQKNVENYLFPQGDLINLQTIPYPIYDEKKGVGLFISTVWMEALQRQIIAANGLLYFDNWQNSFLTLLHSIKFFDVDFTTLIYHGPGILTRLDGDYTPLVHNYGLFNVGLARFWDGNPRLPFQFNFGYSTDKFSKAPGDINLSHHGPSIAFGSGYNLPTKLQGIFPKRQLYAEVKYYKSMDKLWDFSLLQANIKAGTNLFLEDLGVVSRFNFTKAEGAVSPSALTGVDQDYVYNIPRDYRNTKTVRGVDRNIFGDQLLWSSTEISYVIAPKTSMKILILPVDEVAVSAFFDGARIEDSNLSLSTEVYSYGGEFSFGYGVLRFATGYAQGYVDSQKLKGRFYGRINLLVDGLF
jgi:hypothetical protein